MGSGPAEKAKQSRRLRAFLQRRMAERGLDVAKLGELTRVPQAELDRCLAGRDGSRMIDFLAVVFALGVDLGDLYEAVGRKIPESWRRDFFDLEVAAVINKLRDLFEVQAFYFTHYPGADVVFGLRTRGELKKLSNRLSEIDTVMEARDGAALALLELIVQIVRCAERLGMDFTSVLYSARQQLPRRAEEAAAGGEAVEGLRFSATSRRWIEMLIQNASPTIRDQVLRALEVDRKKRAKEAGLWEEAVSEVSRGDDGGFRRKDVNQSRGG